jgi:adenosylcobinamide-GDP ribazoletransferase
VKGVLCALAFLTRIPVPRFVHEDVRLLRAAARWFPFIGLMLGALYTAAAAILQRDLPGSVVAVLLISFDALLTGALHLDGLADMADGFGGGRTREDVLRIMRDHAIGSYGAVALLCALLLKVACLSELLHANRALWILLLAPALSRWSILLLSQSLPYARKPGEGSHGSGSLTELIKRSDLVFGTVVCAVLPFAFGIRRTLACWLGVAVVTMLMARWCRTRIGGITGDTLGANVVLCEAVQFTIAVAVNTWS